MTQIAVVDYGIGNVFSVCNALSAAGADVTLTRDRDTLLGAAKLVLPGVGAFSKARSALDDLGLVEVLQSFVKTGKPFLGICVGMQLMLDSSNEFVDTSGLGLIPGKVTRIPDTAKDGSQLLIPHIAWGTLIPPKAAGYDRWTSTPLAPLQNSKSATYFVHSFHAECADPDHELAHVYYGGQPLTAAIRKDNLTGFQFHPERSGLVGQQILSCFLSDRS